ncbi:protein O-mannosyl-transferase Tmtc3-like isoform X4 [Dermacentor albipictus]|uniref:protein O-mannosyl-transferase Tmtc3-like isoform X4 n=1 Tax=Dermacentor albipictus TaxID=60249 RepID=UPI0031FD6AE7
MIVPHRTHIRSRSPRHQKPGANLPPLRRKSSCEDDRLPKQLKATVDSKTAGGAAGMLQPWRKRRPGAWSPCAGRRFPPRAAHAVLVAAAACSAYASSLGVGLVFDDLAAVKANRDLRQSTPIANLFFNDFWGTPLRKEQSHKSYRPLTVLTFRLNFAVHGLDPFGYHLVNLLLHALVCLLYHRMCLMLLPGWTSLLAALLFSAQPIHTEAVTSIVGRAELLSAVFFLGALLFYIRHGASTAVCKEQSNGHWRRCLTTFALATAAMLCKEQGITVLAVCCIYELASCANPWSSSWTTAWGALKDSLYRVFTLASLATAAVVARIHFNGPHLPAFNRFDNPASVAPSPSRQLTYNYLTALNAWLLVFPSDLCCDWTMGTVPLVTSLADVRNLGTIALYLFLAMATRAALRADEQHRKPLLMGLSLACIPYLPASNLLHPVGFVIAERVLYLPSLGFCLLVAQGFSLLWQQHRFHGAWLKVGVTILLLTHFTKTFLRNYDWSSEQALYQSALRVNPRNAKMLNNLGQVLEASGAFEEAHSHFTRAIRAEPDDIRGHLNLGRLLTTMRHYEKAEAAFVKALSLLPKPESSQSPSLVRVTSSHLQVYLDFAFLIAQNSSRMDEADKLYQEAISLRSDFTDAYLNRGDFLLRMNRTKEAEAMYERALELDENNPDLYYNLGVILMDQGRNDEAMALFNRALELEPDHEHALLNSALLLQEAGSASQKKVANERLEKVVHSGKRDERAYFHLAMLALDKKDPVAAENWLRKAVLVQPKLRSALFNLALLLSEQQRPMEAMRFLKDLLKYHPNHIKGLVLLGDINVNHLKDLEAAEECYRRILALDPGNVQGSHNLCVVYVERGELSRAERCFKHATTLDPNATYIRKHLQVTQTLLRNRSVDAERRSGAALAAPQPPVLQPFASAAAASAANAQ